MRIITATLVLLAFGACPKDDTDTDTDDTGAAEDCESVLADDCADNPLCHTIDGRQMQLDELGAWCVDFTVAGTPQGCMLADMGCGSAETLAAPPDDPDSCWWFSSTCTPAGWVACDSTEYGECLE